MAQASPPPPHATTNTPGPPTLGLAERARHLSEKLIIVDGHIDLPHRLRMSSVSGRLTEDVSVRTEAGHFDYPRARAGGLDAPFMSIYVPVTYEASGGARALADQLIDTVEQLTREHPSQFALAASPEAVRTNTAAGKISLPLGIENGTALEGRVENVLHFRRRGVSYITLTHSRNNALGGSSYDPVNAQKGLSTLGREVVLEMNKVGIMVDLSHASDATFFEAVRLSRAPVIASHSSLRHFVPGFQRNVSDALLEELAQHGGVVMINFGSEFLLPPANAVVLKRWQLAAEFAQKHGLNREKAADRKRIDDYLAATLPVPYARVQDVADHIDRVKRLVGIDHVGIGSDFDGLGDSLPSGLEDVSQYPNLIEVLLERGYTEPELEQICSGNVLRVWQQVLDLAQTTRPDG
jgi:membrane dipeptidase